MSQIQLIYNKLHSSFGPQGWWPLTISGHKTMHHSGDPRNDKHRLEIVIGAILTQNTSWKNVEKALYNLSKNKLIDLEKLKKIKKGRLAELIRPSGYYNQKAERLKIMADFLSMNSMEKLKKLPPEELRKKLLPVNGIGPETADSIILYAFQKPIFVIDAYTKRIYSRIFNAKEQIKYDELQDVFLKNLNIKNNNEKIKVFNEYHALLVELGKNYCKKIPICTECPINKLCRSCQIR
ncbi:endonuclease [Candidatus Woesearchaeota archaeon]|nr:endonuclease [Candidatus Woesearchaeota archaeon]